MVACPELSVGVVTAGALAARDVPEECPEETMPKPAPIVLPTGR